MASRTPDGLLHLRSFICAAGHELRVTRRCVEADLGLGPDDHLEHLLRHPIIKAFISERTSELRGTTTVGPAAGDNTLWVLRRTHRHRGATWYDQELNVVWLCAYSRHRSGDPDDAFPKFDEMRESREIWPLDEDRQALLDDRAERFAAVVQQEGEELLKEARAEPGVEHTRVIGTTHPVGLLVHIVETLEETYLAISGATMNPAQLQLLLVALYPDSAFNEWRPEERLPTRELDVTRAEFCLSIAHESPAV